jgi:uncharacterized membrane protein/mono/diheme cytochrome c family protein
MLRPALAFCLALCFLSVPAWAQDFSNPETAAWFEVGGRTHVALVHFPIALILVALFLEIWAMLRSRAVSPAGLVCLNLGWIGGLFTAVSGWYLARLTTGDIEVVNPVTWLQEFPEAEDDQDLFLHAWTGIGSTVLAFILTLFGALARRRERSSTVYRLGLVVAGLLVAWAGHMGGELVHGEDFLVEPLEALREAEAEEESEDDDSAVGEVGEHDFDPEGADAGAGEDGEASLDGASGAEAPKKAPSLVGAADQGAAVATKPAEAAVQEPAPPVARLSYREHIEPIFAQHCFKCHGETRGKGGLRMHTRAELFPTDIEDWTVIPGKPADSLLLERIMLDPSSRKFMPKKGDPLPEKQVELIKLWIEQGALWEDASRPVKGPEPKDDSAAETPSSDALPDIDAKRARLERLDTLVAAIRARGAAAAPLARGDERLDLNFSVLRDRFQSSDLDALRGFEPQVVELNLAATGADDATLTKIADFVSLERLHLEKTQVTDAGLERLKPLQKLRYLNLYGTQISDAGLDAIAELKGLKKLYLWDSQVSPEGAKTLQTRLPELKIDLGESLLIDAEPVSDPK